METITNLIKDTPIPKMVRVRQNFDKTCIPENDIPGIILRELDRQDPARPEDCHYLRQPGH